MEPILGCCGMAGMPLPPLPSGTRLLPSTLSTFGTASGGVLGLSFAAGLFCADVGRARLGGRIWQKCRDKKKKSQQVSSWRMEESYQLGPWMRKVSLEIVESCNQMSIPFI